MLRAIVIFMIILAAGAVPTAEDFQAKILKYDNENDGKGNYHFNFETSNGLTREETGTLVNPGQPDEHIEVRGNFKYYDEQGVPHIVHYIANQDGFQILPEQKLPPMIVSGQAAFGAALPGAAVATLLG